MILYVFILGFIFWSWYLLYAWFSFLQIAVVVFPSPEEVKARSMKRFREMIKEVPADAVNEMLGNGRSFLNCVLMSYISVVLLRPALYFWQQIMFYLSAGICLVQMSFLMR